MGKANKVKGDLVNVNELFDLIQVLKDVADNKFHALISQKDRFARFGESFIEFFRLISLTEVKHPLLTNDNPTVGILVITSEGRFLGDLNTKVIRTALSEKVKYPNSALIVIGKKGAFTLSSTMEVMKVFEDIDKVGLYETANHAKDFLIQEVKANRIGRVIAVYPWPKNLNLIKPRIVKLLPCEDLLAKQAELVDTIERVIQESDVTEIIGYLANIWLATRIYEMLYDMNIAAAAAQSQQLENSLNKMKKERTLARIKFRKAKKSDIDASLREVFSAKLMLEKKAHR